MSYYADVVVWQSADGTWSMGSHPEDYLNCDSDCDDETHEWCREFDQNSFGWVSAGHPTADAAWKSWDRANHGGGSECSYDFEAGPTPAIEGDDRSPNHWNEHYDDLAAMLCETEAAKPRERSGWGRVYAAYNGPARTRTLKAVQAERNQMRAEWYSHRINGYSNGLHSDEPALTARINDMLKKASPQEREDFRQRQVQHLAKLDEIKARHDEATRRQNSYRGYGYGGYNPNAARERAARQAALEEAATYRAAVEASTTPPPAPPAPQPPAPTKPAPAPVAKKAAAKKTTAPTPAKKAPVAKKTPAKAAPKPAPAPAARRKTTPKSTPGSFATQQRPEATGIDLSVSAGSNPADPSDPWAPLPDA